MQDIQDRTGTIPAKTNEGRLEEHMLSMDSLLHASLDRAMIESEFDDIAGEGIWWSLSSVGVPATADQLAVTRSRDTGRRERQPCDLTIAKPTTVAGGT